MRMPPDHLGRNGVRHVGEVEALLLGRHLRVVNDLEQEVAELVLQIVEIVARDRVGDLVGFLDRVGRDRREALLHVPRTACLRIAQPRHDAQQIVERVPLARRYQPMRPRSTSRPSVLRHARLYAGHPRISAPPLHRAGTAMTNFALRSVGYGPNPIFCPISWIRIRYIMENIWMGDLAAVIRASAIQQPRAAHRVAPSADLNAHTRAAAISMPLVMIAHELVEQAHAKP